MLSFADHVLFLSAHISNLTDANSKQLHMLEIKLVSLFFFLVFSHSSHSFWPFVDQLNRIKES